MCSPPSWNHGNTRSTAALPHRRCGSNLTARHCMRLWWEVECRMSQWVTQSPASRHRTSEPCMKDTSPHCAQELVRALPGILCNSFHSSSRCELCGQRWGSGPAARESLTPGLLKEYPLFLKSSVWRHPWQPHRLCIRCHGNASRTRPNRYLPTWTGWQLLIRSDWILSERRCQSVHPSC